MRPAQLRPTRAARYARSAWSSGFDVSTRQYSIPLSGSSRAYRASH